MLLALVSATTGPTPSPSSTGSPSATPSGAPSVIEIPGLDRLLEQTDTAGSAVVCGPDDVSVCGVVLRLTGDQRIAQVAEVLLGVPLRVLLLVLFGLLVRQVLHRVIDRLADGVARGLPGTLPTASLTGGRTDQRRSDGDRRSTAHAVVGGTPLAAARREARARTLASVLRSVTTAVVAVVVTLMVLQELGFSVAPLLASAGVAGVAIGFGAQSLVRDVVSGLFMIVEDQYGVGDVIDVKDAVGTVEAVGLRVTRLRDVDGTVWYVRNGGIQRVGNQSQGWARVVLDVAIGYGEDVQQAEQVLLDTARALAADPAHAAAVLDEPEVWGVEALTSEAVVIRLVIRTHPGVQWAVARELRRRVLRGLETAGITLPAQPWAVAGGENGMRGDEDDGTLAE